MNELWTNEEAKVHVEFMDFDPVWNWPKPDHEPHPPVLLGGESRYTLQRVVDYCNGWFPRGRAPQRVKAALTKLEKIAEEAARERSRISFLIFVASADRESIDGWKAIGADRCIFWLPSKDDRDVTPLSRLDRCSELL